MPCVTVRELPIDRLVPAPYNPRRPLTKPAYRKLKASLAEFGLVEPLVWNARTGHVVGGHARLAILRELGYEAVPVSVVDLDADRERALNVVLNNQEAQGRYDPTKLLVVLEELGDLRDLSGFDDTTLAALKLSPVEGGPEDAETGKVEITIEVDAKTLPHLSPRLDALVREFDLVAHVKWC